MKTVIYKLRTDFMPADSVAEDKNIFEDTSNTLNLQESRMMQKLSEFMLCLTSLQTQRNY